MIVISTAPIKSPLKGRLGLRCARRLNPQHRASDAACATTAPASKQSFDCRHHKLMLNFRGSVRSDTADQDGALNDLFFRELLYRFSKICFQFGQKWCEPFGAQIKNVRLQLGIYSSLPLCKRRAIKGD